MVCKVSFLYNPFAVSLKSSGTLLESYLIRQSVPLLPLVLSIELHLPEYSEQVFQNIVIKLAFEKHKWGRECGVMRNATWMRKLQKRSQE
jgi:hypothetical protein